MDCAVELLSVGNELLLGNTVNTNASWLGAQITAAGAQVTRITTVGDDLTEISSAVKESLRRHPNVLITTGGIGPTFDDMTLKAVGRALKRRVRVNREALVLMRKHYARRFGGKLPKLTGPRLKMASIPQGSVPIENPVGTAPAVQLTVRGTTIYCLPGVPSEAKAIFLESVLPKIRANAGGRSYVERWFELVGIMESTLAPIIDRVMAQASGVYIKSHPRGVENGVSHIELHFSTFASERAEGIRSLRGAVEMMKRELRHQPGTVHVKERPNPT